MSAYSINSRGLAGRKIPQGTLTPIGTLLFSASEPGAWYDPSDMSTLFQDSAGTTPVTAVEQPVGRILDKSGRGNHATQATTTKRPVYSRRVNALLATTTLATQSVTTLAAAYRLVFSGTGSVTLSGTASGVYGAGTHAITCTAGSLTLTVSGTVQDASLTLATDAHLPYQWVNTATDYDADPAKFPAYLRFDGVDDALQTGNINFTSTDKMTVWAGVTKLSDASVGLIAHTGIYNGTPGFLLSSPTAASLSTIGFRVRRSVLGPLCVVSGLVAPINCVLACHHDAANTTARANGSQGIDTGTAGAGNFASNPLWLGSQDGVGGYFNGRLYGLIVRGAQTPLSQIEATELYIKQKMRMP